MENRLFNSIKKGIYAVKEWANCIPDKIRSVKNFIGEKLGIAPKQMSLVPCGGNDYEKVRQFVGEASKLDPITGKVYEILNQTDFIFEMHDINPIAKDVEPSERTQIQKTYAATLLNTVVQGATEDPTIADEKQFEFAQYSDLPPKEIYTNMQTCDIYRNLCEGRTYGSADSAVLNLLLNKAGIQSSVVSLSDLSTPEAAPMGAVVSCQIGNQTYFCDPVLCRKDLNTNQAIAVSGGTAEWDKCFYDQKTFFERIRSNVRIDGIQEAGIDERIK